MILRGIATCPLNLQVTPEDFLPKLICTHCMDLVNRFYQFRETCMNTHMKLMQCSNSEDSSQVTSTSEVCMCDVMGPLQNTYL